MRDLPLKTGCFRTESWSYNARTILERALEVKAHDSYGLSEMNGPGVAFECKKQDELLFWSDHFIVKVLKPGVLSAQRVSEASWFSVAHQRGSSADLVPDDVTYTKSSNCACARTSIRTAKILG